MMDKLQARYGFARMLFGPRPGPGILHRHPAHNEAVARITSYITDIGVITGEVVPGTTVWVCE
jgi:type II secretory pathway predicted ATPase ExeA